MPQMHRDDGIDDPHQDGKRQEPQRPDHCQFVVETYQAGGALKFRVDATNPETQPFQHA
jgi:hypothetical protein